MPTFVSISGSSARVDDSSRSTLARWLPLAILVCGALAAPLVYLKNRQAVIGGIKTGAEQVKDILTGKRFWAHGPGGDARPPLGLRVRAGVVEVPVQRLRDVPGPLDQQAERDPAADQPLERRDCCHGAS